MTPASVSSSSLLAYSIIVALGALALVDEQHHALRARPRGQLVHARQRDRVAAQCVAHEPGILPAERQSRVASARMLDADGWRTLLDGVTDHTIGVEEELMLLHPETLDLLPAAARVRAELGETVSLRTELPAAQVETASPVCATIGEAATRAGGCPPRARRRRRGLGAAGERRHAPVRRRPRAS